MPNPTINPEPLPEPTPNPEPVPKVRTVAKARRTNSVALSLCNEIVSGNTLEGATEQTPVEPPWGVPISAAPSGESASETVQKTRAVADAMIQLGENADPKQVAEVIEAKTGVILESSEVASIQATLREHAKIPPGPDQPPPEDARRNPSIAPSEGRPMDTSTKEPR